MPDRTGTWRFVETTNQENDWTLADFCLKVQALEKTSDAIWGTGTPDVTNGLIFSKNNTPELSDVPKIIVPGLHASAWENLWKQLKVNAVFSDKEVAARPRKEHLEILRKVHAVHTIFESWPRKIQG